MNYITFCGSESTGSIGKQNLQKPKRDNPPLTAPMQNDTVNFRGAENPKKSSFLGTLTKLLIATGVIVGGLGYAHKAGWVNKLKEGKMKDLANKVTEPCHDACTKVKGWATDGWNKVKNMFNKN